MPLYIIYTQYLMNQMNSNTEKNSNVEKKPMNKYLKYGLILAALIVSLFIIIPFMMNVFTELIIKYQDAREKRRLETKKRELEIMIMASRGV